MFMHYANDAKTFLKHFSDCLFYFCSTCVDCFTVIKLVIFAHEIPIQSNLFVTQQASNNQVQSVA